MSRELTAALEGWFARHARDLPWRRRRTGYTALVAEAMLQQTQVARVAEHYGPFLRRFPTVRRLAEADEQSVLAAWQGLGYYRRARNLHAAARRIVADSGGRVPRRAEDLRRLPGIGRYTAGAVASIVYGAREPIVDGNVHRVLTRLGARAGSAADPAMQRWAWARATALVADAAAPGVFNEALMELGATVCTPRAPRCPACPLVRFCRARRAGRPEAFPDPKPPPTRRRMHFHTVVVRRGDKVLFEQRPQDGLWSTMWQTPTIEAPRRLAAGAIVDRLPLRVTDLALLASFEHQTTHRRIRFHVLGARSRVRRGTWRHPGDTEDLPMSNAQRRVLAMAGEA